MTPVWYRVHYADNDVKKLRQIADRLAPFMGPCSYRLSEVVRELEKQVKADNLEDGG